jgi:hypothetical protein
MKTIDDAIAYILQCQAVHKQILADMPKSEIKLRRYYEGYLDALHYALFELSNVESKRKRTNKTKKENMTK